METLTDNSLSYENDSLSSEASTSNKIYNSSQHAIDVVKDLLATKYYKTKSFDVLLSGDHLLDREKKFIEVIGNLVCDLMLLAHQEKVRWRDVEAYAKRHFDIDKNYLNE